VLGRELGAGYRVVEDGLNGRTTVRDDPLEPCLNGRALLAPALLSHQPLDLVPLMLGTTERLGAESRRRFSTSVFSSVLVAMPQLADVTQHVKRDVLPAWTT
jgi:hypothetical protein